MRFKIGSSCSCGNLNRLKALYNAGFRFAVQVVQVVFGFLKKIDFILSTICNVSLKINIKKIAS